MGTDCRNEQYRFIFHFFSSSILGVLILIGVEMIKQGFEKQDV